MARLACIDLPAFPLQLLLRRERSWAGKPAVVVEEDKPLARVLWANEAARRFEILPGMRYAAALSLCSDLFAGTVDPVEIDQAVQSVCELLRRFSPDVEAARHAPGTFWVDASGLQPLHPTLLSWARRIDRTLRHARLASRIVVGFCRFGTFALARAAWQAPPAAQSAQSATQRTKQQTKQRRRGTQTAGPAKAKTARAQTKTPTKLAEPVVIMSAEEERAQAELVSLDRLSLTPRARDALMALGIDTVAGFLKLPPAGLQERYGDEVLELHRIARGEWDTPLQGETLVESIRQEALLDEPERNVNRLLFWIKRLLDPLLAGLVRRREALCEFILELRLDRPGVPGGVESCVERLTPAQPTVDAQQLLPLLLLRLNKMSLRGGVVELALDAVSAPATTDQLSLFYDATRRDRRAARRAFARLRAEFGDETVVYAQLRPAHLPEATFSWTPLRSLHAKTASETNNTSKRRARARKRIAQALPAELESPRQLAVVTPPPMLIRRLYTRPVVLPRRLRHEEDGWQVRGRDDAAVDEVVGPFVVSGGWWRALEADGGVHREYHFLHNQAGEWLWAYYDRPRRRWFLQGRVE